MGSITYWVVECDGIHEIVQIIGVESNKPMIQFFGMADAIPLNQAPYWKKVRQIHPSALVETT